MSALTSGWWEGLQGSPRQPRRVMWPVAVSGGPCLGNVRAGFVRLDHVHRNLPGAIWTAAQEVCLREVSEASFTTCGIQTIIPSACLGAEAASCRHYPLHPYSTAIRFVAGYMTVQLETIFFSFPCS